MSQTRKSNYWLLKLLIPLVVVMIMPAAFAEGTAPSGTSNEDANEGTAWTIRQNYFKRFKFAEKFGPSTAGGHDVINGKESEKDGKVKPNGPVFKWPKKVESAEDSTVPTKRDEGIMEFQVETFGYPVSDTQFQAIGRLNDNMMLEEAFDPERWMWMETSMGALKATSAANSVANLGRNQAIGAIEFAQTFLVNFTSDGDNVWNKIRNQLFIPMAILLLLPGAVLSQVRAIIAQGTTVLGEVNPFDGILRSIVAIFLIPATWLVVNYGIDVSNLIAKSIRDGYSAVFQSDMYQDAMCAQKRAFPIRNKDDNKNQIPATASTGNSPSSTTSNDPYSQLEAISFNIGAQEDCGGGGGNSTPSAFPGGSANFPGFGNSNKSQSDKNGQAQSQKKAPAGTFESLMETVAGNGTAGQAVADAAQNPEKSQTGESKSDDGKTDEESPVLKSTQRLVVNGANAGLTATWNVLCAFQMAYLYYLFCIGPVVAALWVWPMQQLRGALPSWIEGVVTLCFWSLFWNTTILLMAAFRGVGDTGTIIMTALNFLSTACVKHAFDFAGLVKSAGEQAGKEATKGMQGGGGKGAGSGHGAGAQAGAGHFPGGAQGSQAGTGTGHGAGSEAGAGSAAASGSHSTSGATSSHSSLAGEAAGGQGHRGLSAGHTLPPGESRGAGSTGNGSDSQGGEVSAPPLAGGGSGDAGGSAAQGSDAGSQFAGTGSGLPSDASASGGTSGYGGSAPADFSGGGSGFGGSGSSAAGDYGQAGYAAGGSFDSGTAVDAGQAVASYDAGGPPAADGGVFAGGAASGNPFVGAAGGEGAPAGAAAGGQVLSAGGLVSGGAVAQGGFAHVVPGAASGHASTTGGFAGSGVHAGAGAGGVVSAASTNGFAQPGLGATDGVQLLNSAQGTLAGTTGGDLPPLSGSASQFGAGGPAGSFDAVPSVSAPPAAGDGGIGTANSASYVPAAQPIPGAYDAPAPSVYAQAAPPAAESIVSPPAGSAPQAQPVPPATSDYQAFQSYSAPPLAAPADYQAFQAYGQTQAAPPVYEAQPAQGHVVSAAQHYAEAPQQQVSYGQVVPQPEYHQAPAQAPSYHYQEPSPQYHAPAPQYHAPAEPQYHAPAPQEVHYQSPSYQAPSYQPASAYVQPQHVERSYREQPHQGVDRALTGGILGSALGRAASPKPNAGGQPAGQKDQAAAQGKNAPPQQEPRKVDGSLQNQMRPGGNVRQNRRNTGEKKRSTKEQEKQ